MNSSTKEFIVAIPLFFAIPSWVIVFAHLYFGHDEVRYVLADAAINTVTAAVSVFAFVITARNVDDKNHDTERRFGRAFGFLFLWHSFGRFLIFHHLYPSRWRKISSVPFEQNTNYLIVFGFLTVILALALGLWIRLKSPLK